MSDQSSISYFQKRMDELGVTAENNVIHIWQENTNVQPSVTELVPVPIFTESDKGIDILVYTLDGHKILYNKQGKRHRDHLFITRLEHPKIRANGDVQKYDKPKDIPSYPFFPPTLCTAYREEKHIPTLYLTEGFFKAFKADLHGIPCVGVQSITTLRDKTTDKLFGDIIKLITTCKVQRLVWLTDGDFMEISSKEISEHKDLYKRPNLFFSTVYKFWELTSAFVDVEKYFAHINTENLEALNKPKGLDDLLIIGSSVIDNIVSEFLQFDKIKPGAKFTGTYITRLNVTFGVGRVREYFKLHDVNQFYLHHSEKRDDLRQQKVFVFNGTKYKWDEEKGTAEVQVPGDASLYIRVGNDYFKMIQKPDKYGSSIKQLRPRMKGTIVDDHGKDFIKHIVKYDDFTVDPNHVNYQQVVDSCYNLYYPFIHEAEDGECEYTIKFLQHLFGHEKHTVYHNGHSLQVERWELMLDYVQILYRYPKQVLPIPCLVSLDRQTGKSTFGKWLSWLFANNVISIGNEDMKADFNAHWANKLIIICDETKLDSHEVIQKVKRLSTADSIVMNAKGKDQVEVNFFAKFILMSNSVDDFIKIDKEEIRFWVHEVPPLKVKDPDFEQKLLDEIPYFINFLNNRKLITHKKERHWFDTSLLQTEALQRVKENSLSTLSKRIKQEITDLMLLDSLENETLTLPLSYIAELCGQKDKIYVQRELKKMGYKTMKGRFKYPKRKIESITSLNQPTVTTTKLETIEDNSTYYEFKRSDFTEYSNKTKPQQEEDDVPF